MFTADETLLACDWPTHPPPLDIPLTLLPPEPNPYKPGEQWQIRGLRTDAVHPEIYHDLMDRNFRRSGDIFYQPVGRGAADCRQLRVPTATFRPSRSQRRCMARNSDLTARFVLNAPPSDEQYALYARYLHARHDGAMDASRDAYQRFLHQSPVRTGQFEYRDPAGRLVCVSVCDICLRSVSSVYCYFDPEQAVRSLGVFSACSELAIAAGRGIPFYYFGYWVPGCRTMDYKITFRPCEVLDLDGRWRRLSDEPSPTLL